MHEYIESYALLLKSLSLLNFNIFWEIVLLNISHTLKKIFENNISKNVLFREEQLSFDDLAYHDSCIYDSLSSMIIDAFSGKYTDQEFTDLYCFRFEVGVSQVAANLDLQIHH